MSWKVDYPASDYLLIGRVVRPHGLKGELKIFCFSGQPENFSQYSDVVLVDLNGRLSPSLAITRQRIQNQMLIVQLAGIVSRSDAEEVQNAGVLVTKKTLPETDDGEYYWHQWIGKTLLTKQNEVIGSVENIFHNGAQDVLVVKNDDEEFFIPVTGETITEATEDFLLVSLPPGLLDINKDSFN